MAGATSLQARYHVQPGTRNHSTDEQLDGGSFRLSRRPSGSSRPITSPSLTRVRSDHVDSDPEVDTVVRKASLQHHEVATEPVRMDSSQSLHQTHQTTTQAAAHGQTRGRSKTISSIPQNPSSFVKLARDKLLRMESDPSPATMALSLTPGSHNDTVNLTPSPSIKSIPQNSSSSTLEDSTMRQAPDTAERVQSAPVRRERPAEQDIRPNAGRSQSDTAVMPSPTKAGSDKPSDVRKRIEELEAKMRGGTSR